MGLTVAHRAGPASRAGSDAPARTSVEWVRQLRQPARRWLPGRPLVVVVAGGFAAVSLALACVKSPVAMVSRRRWDAALSHQPAPHPPGKRGPQPLQGQRQRRWQAWAERAATPWETVEVDWYGGRRQTLWGFAHTALGTRAVCPPSTSAWCWWGTQRASCGWKRSSAPTCRPPRCRSWRGWSCAGPWRSPWRRGEPSSGWTPNAKGGPRHCADHPSPVGPVLTRHPAGLAVEP